MCARVYTDAHSQHIFVILQNLPLLGLRDQFNLGAAGPRAAIKHCADKYLLDASLEGSQKLSEIGLAGLDGSQYIKSLLCRESPASCLSPCEEICLILTLLDDFKMSKKIRPL